MLGIASHNFWNLPHLLVTVKLDSCDAKGPIFAAAAGGRIKHPLAQR
jgi:hypothetical protein